jgi:hypothetical protein
LSSPRRLAGLSPVHVLVLVAVAELSITRLAVPTLRPKPGEAVPVWFEVLDNLGLFLLYFGTTLAIAVLALRAWELFQRRAQVPPLHAVARFSLASVLLACGLIAGVTVVVAPNADLSFALHTAWAAAIIGIVIAAFARRRDLGIAIGLAAIASPLLVHYGAIFAGNVVLTEDELGNGSLIERARDWGLHTLVLAALLSPYCFSPRPVVRAVSKVAPIVVAMLVGGLGAVLVRREYKAAMDLASLGVGIDLGPGVPPGDMALYLLATATLAWTLCACALAESEARREVGMGLGMIVLGGYGFEWPFHFLLGIVGMFVILDAAPRLADEEAPRAIRPRTPAIDDEVWQTWVAQLVAELRKTHDAELKTVTVRGDDEGSTTVMVGERHGVPFKARFGRIGGALVSIDVVVGRELGEDTRATFTLYARPDGREAHPPPPPAAPAVHVDDESFSARFRVRGDADAVLALLDEAHRARAAALLDGWIAWWSGTGLRYRVFPAIGAPLDHPVPISDLAMRGAGTVERMSGAIDLVTAIAARGLGDATDGKREPAVLD